MQQPKATIHIHHKGTGHRTKVRNGVQTNGNEVDDESVGVDEVIEPIAARTAHKCQELDEEEGSCGYGLREHQDEKEKRGRKQTNVTQNLRNITTQFQTVLNFGHRRIAECTITRELYLS